MKKISLGSWAFTFGPYSDHPIPLDAVVHRASEAGYDGVELSGFPPHATLATLSETSRRRALQKRMEDRGIRPSGFVPDLTAASPIAPGNRGRYLDLFQRNLELAADLGCPSIRVDSVAAPGSVPDEEYESAFEHLAETWHKASEFAAGTNIRVNWEFEPGFVFNKPTEIVELHEKVRHPNFYVLFDTAHAYICAEAGARQHGKPEKLRGGVEGLLDRCAGRIGGLHLVDTDGSLYNDETSTHLPPGLGVIDFAKLASKLRATGTEWWTIDLSFYPGAWQEIDRCLAFARALNA